MAIDLGDLATAISELVVRFRIRRRTAADWTTGNETLLSAEFGYETDTKKIKIGDGVTPWNSLDYWNSTGLSLTSKNAGVGIDISQKQDTTGGTGGDYASDANFAHRLFVAHFDDLDGSGNAIDSGPLGAIIAPVGTNTISATQSKYGGFSSHGDAGGTVARTGWSTTDTGQFDFGTADFTLEGWFYASGNRGGAGVLTLFQKTNGTSTSDVRGPGIRVSDDGSGSVVVYISCSDGTSLAGVFTGDFRTGHTPGSGTWVHVAVVRHTTAIKLYLNGVAAAQTGSDGDASSLTIGTKSLLHALDNFYIGASGHVDSVTGPGPVNLSTSWRGYIDDARVSAVAEYTANFTAPVAAFPGYASPLINVGDPYPVIANTGVLSVVGGSNIVIDSTDPANPIITSTGGGISPDTHPTSPTVWDDEFEYGTAIDTTGARFSGANAWVEHHPTGTVAPSVSHGMLGADYVNGIGVSSVLLQPLPGTDCSFVCKVQRTARPSTGSWSFGLFDSSTGRLVTILYYGGNITSATVAISEGTLNTSTWAYTGSSNPYAGFPIDSNEGPSFLRIRRVGTNTYYGWNQTGHEAMWVEPGVQADATWAANPTHVALFLASASGTVDWFRRVV